MKSSSTKLYALLGLSILFNLASHDAFAMKTPIETQEKPATETPAQENLSNDPTTDNFEQALTHLLDTLADITLVQEVITFVAQDLVETLEPILSKEKITQITIAQQEFAETAELADIMKITGYLIQSINSFYITNKTIENKNLLSRAKQTLNICLSIIESSYNTFSEDEEQNVEENEEPVENIDKATISIDLTEPTYEAAETTNVASAFVASTYEPTDGTNVFVDFAEPFREAPTPICEIADELNLSTNYVAIAYDVLNRVKEQIAYERSIGMRTDYPTTQQIPTIPEDERINTALWRNRRIFS